MTSAITIRSLTKSYGSTEVLRNFDLDIPSHSVISLVGPTGGGKTTLLNLISGIDIPDFGDINTAFTSRGALGYMMQNDLLLPWRTLSENALLGAEVLGFIRDDICRQLEFYFQLFDLHGHENGYPEASSGGMKQRVALIRTLLIRPKLLLLDEPFSNLDFDIKLQIQKHLIQYQYDNGTTVLLVTHDIEDAITLSDEVIVLSDPPAKIKARVRIDLNLIKKDPVEARKSPKFSDYFGRIWDELKYL